MAELVTCATKNVNHKAFENIVGLTCIAVRTIIRYRRSSIRRAHQGSIAAGIRACIISQHLEYVLTQQLAACNKNRRTHPFNMYSPSLLDTSLMVVSE